MLLCIIPFHTLYAQLERERAVKEPEVELTFMAPRNINLYTVHQVSKGELHYSIMHTFGEVNTGPRNLWGIDQGANVRFSFEYGIGKNISLVLGRSSMDKVIDLGTRISTLKQKKNGGAPVSVSLIPVVGINSSDLSFLDEEYLFTDRLNYSLSLPIARKFTPNLSLQVSPILAHFNRVGPELSLSNPTENTYFSTAFSGRYKIKPRTALSFQYVPDLGIVEGVESNLAIGIDIETGGHVFQMFFTTSRALHEPYIIAAQNGNFFKREFRFGFNINRLFRVK
ncbi:MAG: hypothetical protein HUJ22_10735 [Gracilimonas sp.]|uniref:DUF5777 family beta-barrel protein n=1 Tax=Gracilimonas sp. TaxID=1974203 RepID=UPI0019827367|nr:DUF5777 family beta-barrel protein [Gracilimonas sp.]MBD3617034.1 hypothetical protein [Gracilimonas sp.]